MEKTVKSKFVYGHYYKVELIHSDANKWSVNVSYPTDAHADVSEPGTSTLTNTMACKSGFAAKNLYRKLKNGEAIQEIVFGHAPNYLSMYE